MDINAIIGITIGLVLGAVFVALSIPEFKKMNQYKREKEERAKEREEKGSPFDLE